ncbi:MAG: hypothetical protein R6V29_01115 [Spirochaetia bacterium]
MKRSRRATVLALACALSVVVMPYVAMGQDGEGGGADPRAEAKVENTNFLPQVFYVGDRVEMRVEFRLDSQATVRLPEETPTMEWGTLHRVGLEEISSGWELRVSFTPFRPGTQTLPSMVLGDAYLSGVDVPVASILEENRSELAPLRDQLMLPATRVMLAAALGLLVAVPLVWFVSFRWGRRRLSSLVRRYRDALPYRRTARSLRRLSNEMDGMSDREFYIQLLSDFRAYLSRRMHTDALSATTEELATELERYIPSAEDRAAVLEVFHFGDRVKFASQRATARTRAEHLEAVLRVLRHVERKREPRHSDSASASGKRPPRGGKRRSRKRGARVGV